LLRRERARLVGAPLLPFVRKAYVTAFLNHLRRCKRSREEQVSEISINDGPGEERLIELLSVPVIDLHSEKTVYRSTLRDITRRRRAEQALRQSEERFSTAFRASPSAIAIAALEDGSFIDVNSSFCKLTGFTRKELIGRTSLELGFHPDAATRAARIATLREGGTFTSIETPMPTKSGGIREVLVSMELIKLEGRDCVLVIGQDVTELKQLQREVLEITEREQSRIGQDLHDGPCQSFTGLAIHAEVIARELDREHSHLAGKVREIAQKVREGAEEMRRLAAGLFPVKVERDGLAWALEDLAAETRGRCEIECSFAMPRAITIADVSVAIHLYRIAQEAVNNAVCHGQAHNIGIALEASGGAIILRVCDDGIGMPSTLGDKRGIGLHTMQYRAKMLGGSIDIGPAGTRGTLVTCSFPGKDFAYLDETTPG
jgi:PAS domain S-box-containing protein